MDLLKTNDIFSAILRRIVIPDQIRLDRKNILLYEILRLFLDVAREEAPELCSGLWDSRDISLVGSG